MYFLRQQNEPVLSRVSMRGTNFETFSILFSTERETETAGGAAQAAVGYEETSPL